jgi:hypothetical protein
MARAYVHRLHGDSVTVNGVVCVNRDTDGDGYVSCDVSVTFAEEGRQTLSLECAAPLSLNDGCKKKQVLD